MQVETAHEELVEQRIPAGDDFLGREAVQALTPAELTRRTTALAPMIAECAAEAEQLRRPVDRVWSALRRSGYFYQFVPKQFGGMATDLLSFFEATLPIAEACASTAWTASFCAAHNRNLANFPVEAQKEIWGGRFPYFIAPQLGSSKGPVSVEDAEGGVRVSGRWDWASGVVHADWVMAVAMTPQEGQPPKFLMMMVPAEEAEVLDTWRMSGMAGTGSHDVRLSDVFVPEHRILRGMDVLTGRALASTLYGEEVYRAPWISFANVTSSVVGLGAARRAVQSFRSRMGERKTRGSQGTQADRPAAQVRLAEAEIRLRTAEMLLREGARCAGGLGELPMEEQVPERIAFRARQTYAIQLCREAVRLAEEGAGASAQATDQPFQRATRDLRVLAGHVAMEPDAAYELFGRSLLGMAPNTPLF